MFSQKRIFLCFAFFLSACVNFPAVANSNEPAAIPLGPQITLTEQQTQVFEKITAAIEENYIHYDSRPIAWGNLQEKYLTEINTGLTTAEFNELMTQFENEFGADEIIYISREERIEAETSIQSVQFAGIGAFVSYEAKETPHVVILDVMPNSPAEKAGLQAHDSIYAVNGEALNAKEGAEVIQRIRGEAGAPVVLSVQTPGQEKREVQIIRAQVNGIGKLKSNFFNEKIGYLLMPPSVSENIVNDLLVALSDFEKQNMQGLILDLRISNSERNWPLQDMLTMFLNGNVGEIYSRAESQPIDIKGHDFYKSQTIPLIVLVGEHTSGVAEIFAALVKSGGRGIVIGAPTEGNIEASLAYTLPNGGQILIANTSIRTIGNENIGLNGLTPDILIEARWDEINLEQDPVIQRAIEAFEAQP